MKVKLRENLRYFEQDDTDFTIMAKEVKELPIKNLRSYSIKHFLFTGKLGVVEGDVKIKFKSAYLYISPEGLYGKEYGKYFSKDLEFDTMHWHARDEIPVDVADKLDAYEKEILNPQLKEEPKEEPKEEKVDPSIFSKKKKAKKKKSVKEAEKKYDKMDVNKDGKVDLKDVVEVAKSAFTK